MGPTKKPWLSVLANRPRSFMNVLSEIDHPMMMKEWEILTTQKAKRTFPLRLRNPWINDRGVARQKWILASCDQEFDEEGNLKTIMGCMCGNHPGVGFITRLIVAELISVRRNRLKKMPWLVQIWWRRLP